MRSGDKTFDSVEELAVATGGPLGGGDWMIANQERINACAVAAGDHQWALRRWRGPGTFRPHGEPLQPRRLPSEPTFASSEGVGGWLRRSRARWRDRPSRRRGLGIVATEFILRYIPKLTQWREACDS